MLAIHCERGLHHSGNSKRQGNSKAPAGEVALPELGDADKAGELTLLSQSGGEKGLR